MSILSPETRLQINYFQLLTNLWIFGINILFKKFGSFVDWVVCQVNEHVVNVPIRGGVKFSCKPANKKRKYPYQEFRGFRAWTSAGSSSQPQSATDNNWSLGSHFGTTRQLAWVRKVVDFRFKRWLDKSLETYRVVLFNWFHPKSWSGGDDKIPTKKGKLEVYL